MSEKRVARPATGSDESARRAAALEWLSSDEGKKEIAKTAKNALNAANKLREAQAVEPQLLTEPITL